jgi:hypothetical protein
MKSKAFLALWMAIVCFILGGQFAAAAEDVPADEIVQVAREGVKAFLRGIPVGKLQQFGFASQEEADAFVLGKGFRIYAIPPATILDEGVAGDLISLAVPTDLWQFLITSRGRPKAIVTVDRVGDTWMAVSLGAAGLAGQWGKLMKAWPPSEGHTFRVVRVYQAKSDFVEISRERKSVGVLPMTSAKVALGLAEDLSPAHLSTARDLLDKIRPVVRRNIERDERK